MVRHGPDPTVVLQKELCFDDELVLQQLRYTGMLETVRIRRSGYSAKYTFQVGPAKQLPALGIGQRWVDAESYLGG